MVTGSDTDAFWAELRQRIEAADAAERASTERALQAAGDRPLEPARIEAIVTATTAKPAPAGHLHALPRGPRHQRWARRARRLAIAAVVLVAPAITLGYWKAWDQAGSFEDSPTARPLDITASMRVLDQEELDREVHLVELLRLQNALVRGIEILDRLGRPESDLRVEARAALDDLGEVLRAAAGAPAQERRDRELRKIRELELVLRNESAALAARRAALGDLRQTLLAAARVLVGARAHHDLPFERTVELVIGRLLRALERR